MSYTTILSSKNVKIRKPHLCHGCGKRYSIGQIMNKVACIFEGDFSCTYMCPICEEFMKDRWQYYDDRLGFGDIWNDRDYREYRDRFKPVLVVQHPIEIILVVSYAQGPVWGRIEKDEFYHEVPNVISDEDYQEIINKCR